MDYNCVIKLMFSFFFYNFIFLCFNIYKFNFLRYVLRFFCCILVYRWFGLMMYVFKVIFIVFWFGVVLIVEMVLFWEVFLFMFDWNMLVVENGRKFLYVIGFVFRIFLLISLFKELGLLVFLGVNVVGSCLFV